MALPPSPRRAGAPAAGRDLQAHEEGEADLSALVDFSRDRFGADIALRYVDTIERTLEALARGDLEGPELLIASRARKVRRWPVPPYWLYYDRAGGDLRVLRVHHVAREPL
jgi:plasmid stabilization system protein ParE